MGDSSGQQHRWKKPKGPAPEPIPRRPRDHKCLFFRRGNTASGGDHEAVGQQVAADNTSVVPVPSHAYAINANIVLVCEEDFKLLFHQVLFERISGIDLMQDLTFLVPVLEMISAWLSKEIRT